MFIRRYEPRKATVEEVRRYFLRYHCNAPDALFGTAMEIEAYLNTETPGWLEMAGPLNRQPAQA